MTPIKPVWSNFNPVAGLVIGKPTPRMPEPAGNQSGCRRSGETIDTSAKATMGTASKKKPATGSTER